ncbi:MAG: hypothetical protein Q4D90_04165 [bacterium]|nr:hypothetical protein [bacterium]
MEFQYQIVYDESISRWQMTKMGSAAFASPKKAFQAEVNLEESYIQVVYPVREEFLKQNRIAQVQRYDGEYEDLYFPFENNRIDLSTFIHTPHHFWVNARAWVLVEEEGDYPFEIYTCGGVKIWVNGEESGCFAPYTRNIASHTPVQLHLKAGENEIKVYADELAERDVFFYFELRYQGKIPIVGAVQMEANPSEVREAESFLSSLYFERDMYTEGEVHLCYDRRLLKEDRKLYISSKGSGTGGKSLSGSYLERTARKDRDYLVYCEVEDSPIQLNSVFISCKVGPYWIQRGLFVGIIPQKLVELQPKKRIEERKRQALEFLYAHGEGGMQTVVSNLELEGCFGEKAKRALSECLDKIEAHEDCADFSLAPLTLLVTRYASKLPEEELARIKEAVLHFRYWIDEPGNDVMWYFSENHAFLFHISQYLWGHIYPDETFTESGRSGSEQRAIGKQRLEEWFAIFFRYGFAEWNSATYIPIDFIGFFTLYLTAPDADIREMAKRALDFTMRIVSYNTFGKVMNSTYGRVYEGTIKTRIQVETNFIHWIAYGVGYPTFYGSSVHLFAISDYVPGDFDAECAVAEGEGMTQEIDQGILRLKINTFRTQDYLTAAVRRFKPFRHGHQQHLMNVAFGKERAALFYINHPGERLFSGENRPSYWAGNGTMPWIERYENVTVLLFDIDPKELVHYIHAYAPTYEYDTYLCEEHWFFAKTEEAYLAAWFSNPVHLTQEGANTRKELISKGLKHAVVVKCGSKTEFGSFEGFVESMKQCQRSWDGERSLRFSDPQYGEFEVREAGSFWRNGREIPYEPQDGFALHKVNLVQLSDEKEAKTI